MSYQTQQQAKELSFTQKCILLAKISQQKNKLLVNPFDFFPFVKVFCAGLKQENFASMKIKGIFCYLTENTRSDKKKFYLQIYDPRDYSLKINLEVGKTTIYSFTKVNDTFYCIYLNFGCLGFQFQSTEIGKRAYKLLKIEPEKGVLDLYSRVQNIKIENLGNKYYDAIKDLAQTFGNEFINIYYDTTGVEFYDGRKTFDLGTLIDILRMLNNIEYDEEDKKFNIFVDKIFNPSLYYKMAYNYAAYQDPNNPFNVIFNDFINIFNKEDYVNILADHVMKNFKAVKEIFLCKKALKAKGKEQFLPTTEDYIRCSAKLPEQKGNIDMNLDKNAKIKKIKSRDERNVAIKEEPEEYN